MRKHQNFGDSSANPKARGGYQNMDCNDAAEQRFANSYKSCNKKAKMVKTKHQQNHVGGSRAST